MILIVILLAVIVIIFALAGLKVVPQSETRVIERLGKFHKVLPPGLNIIWPIIDRPKLITTRSVVESRMGRPVVQMNASTYGFAATIVSSTFSSSLSNMMALSVR